MKSACLFLLLALPLYAQESHNGLGFAVGQLSGIGFSYRHLPKENGFQVSFGVLSLHREDGTDIYYEHNDDDRGNQYAQSMFQSERGRESHANVGVLVFRVLHDAKRSRFYALAGVSFFYASTEYSDQEYRMGEEGMYYYEPYGNPVKRVERENTLYGGLGIGIEVKFTTNIRAALEWPLTYSSKGDLVMYYPQVGLHYFFK
ncbi:MAG: hypothetical protein EHM72_10610 [Calditrichaeota bacterium]|nr:MAG: hypothetical protein EHM72_10610 [Calditrichota bacterium]